MRDQLNGSAVCRVESGDQLTLCLLPRCYAANLAAGVRG